MTDNTKETQYVAFHELRHLWCVKEGYYSNIWRCAFSALGVPLIMTVVLSCIQLGKPHINFFFFAVYHLLYFSISFKAFSSPLFTVFKANIHLMSLYAQCVWQNKLQRVPFEVASLEIWRRQFTTGSLSKKEKRKDRYNCMCVKRAG